MEADEEHIKRCITGCLEGIELPKEVSFDNEEVLKLFERKVYHSVFFVDKLLFRIIPKKKHYLLEFQRDYEPFFPNLEQPPKEWVKVRLGSIDELITLKGSIVSIIEYELRRTHGEVFGCCSSYVECSDAKKCIHEDFLLSLCCQYRLNLLDNRIFYGTNANDQISAIEDLPTDKKIDYPAPATTSVTFKKALETKKKGHEAMDLFGGGIREEE